PPAGSRGSAPALAGRLPGPGSAGPVPASGAPTGRAAASAGSPSPARGRFRLTCPWGGRGRRRRAATGAMGGPAADDPDHLLDQVGVPVLAPGERDRRDRGVGDHAAGEVAALVQPGDRLRYDEDPD